MTLFNHDEQSQARLIGDLAFSNPFLPERIALERRILGAAHVPAGAVWSADPRVLGDNPNVAEIRRLAERLADGARQRIVAGYAPTPAEWASYEELTLHVLFYRFEDPMYRELEAAPGSAPGPVGYYRAFRADALRFLALPGAPFGARGEPAHLFALLHQFRRAFHFTFRRILGSSLAAARLRAAVWQSIFTRDMRRYRRQLSGHMQDVPTLVVGPSGTGKELVAQAIGASQLIAFDGDAGRFAVSFRETYRPLNVAALPSTLIESELFGHCKGAFTGAIRDHQGHLHGCGPYHTIFLDEVGEIEPAVQVKLLRVLQTRTYQRVGESTPRVFAGKIVAATNRRLADDVVTGRFRPDLYYRLCGDVVTTPSLAEQVRDDPEELRRLVRFAAQRLLGDEAPEELTSEVVTWIAQHLAPDYDWPGNMRELEQCVHSVLVRGEYQPVASQREAEPALTRVLDQCTLSAEQLVARYCAVVHGRTGSYRETGRLLGLDRRTVAAKVARERRRARADRPGR